MWWSWSCVYVCQTVSDSKGLPPAPYPDTSSETSGSVPEPAPGSLPSDTPRPDWSSSVSGNSYNSNRWTATEWVDTDHTEWTFVGHLTHMKVSTEWHLVLVSVVLPSRGICSVVFKHLSSFQKSLSAKILLSYCSSTTISSHCYNNNNNNALYLYTKIQSTSSVQ